MPIVTRHLYSLAEAAETLAVSYSTLQRLVEAGELVKVKVGSKPVITGSSIEAYVERLAGPIERARANGERLGEKQRLKILNGGR